MREEDRFGRYTLVRRLGGGGFASVWLARNTNGEEFALKILHPHHTGESRPSSLSASDRFLREARLLMAFSHPGVVRVLEVLDGRPGGGIGFAMEYLVGRDLEQMLPTISYLRLLDVLARTADILNDIHLAGVIHRDVKLSNIFVCAEDGRTEKSVTELVKVIDFGVAKDAADASLLASTGHGELVGTLETMAPECFRRLEGDHVQISPASDQWGLGVALFYGLTGAPPFTASHMFALIPKVVEEPVPPLVLQPRFGLPSCPPELDAIVRRCLAKDPNRRFGSAREIGDGLRRVAFQYRESISLVAPAIPGGRPDSFPAPDSTLRDVPTDPWDATIRDQPLAELTGSVEVRLPEISIRTDEMFATPSSSGETMLDVAPAEMFRDAAEHDEQPTKRIGIEANIQEPLLPRVERDLSARSAVQKDNTAVFGEEPTPYAIERPSAVVVRAASETVVGNAKIVARDPAATPWQGSVLEGQAPPGVIRPDWVMPLPSIVPAEPPLQQRPTIRPNVPANPPAQRPAKKPPPIPPPDHTEARGLPRWLVIVWLVLGACFAFWLGRRFG